MDTQIITVEVPDGLQNVPFSLELTIPEDCNPATAFVTDKNGCRAPFILSDAFLYGNTGTLTFLIVDSRIKTYYFRCDTGGTRGMPAYSGAVGCGDCLRTAPASVHPLFNGMSAQGFLADIDADGEDELIVTQRYGSVIHRPWHLLNVYRMRDGICGDACPLRARFADGHIDYLHGATHAVCRDGFLYTCGYGTSEEDGTAGAICVYRLNGTFTLDHVGNIPLPPDTGSMTSFQVTEHGIYTAQSRTVKGIKPQDLWFEATEAEIADANWPRWNLESEINFYPYAAAYTLASPISLNIRSHGHMYLDVDPDSGDLYICRSNCNYSALSEHLKTEVVRYARIRDTEFAEAETFEPITSRSPYPITRTRDGRFLCGGGDHGGRLFLDGQPIMQRGPFVNAYAGFAKAEFYGDCILTGCETGFVSLIRRDGEHFTEPERFPVQFSNGPFDDPGSIAEAGLGQTSAYYVDADGDGSRQLLVKCGRRLYRLEDDAGFTELRTESGNRFGAHRNHIAIGDFTGDGIPDIINASDDGHRLLLYRGIRRDGKLGFTDGEVLCYSDGEIIDPALWHRYTKHFSCGDYRGSGRCDLLLSTCTRILILDNLGGDMPRFARPAELLKNCEGTDNIGHHVCMPLVCDWDRTGSSRDILVCGESGMFYLFRRSFIDKPPMRLVGITPEN